MKTSAQFLDDIKKKLELPSDNRAATLIGVERATVSRWRTGSSAMSDETAIRVAELLGEDPQFVLLCAAAERTEDDKARRVYKKIADTFRGAAVLLIALGAGIIGVLSPSNSQASQSNSQGLYIMSYKTWRLAQMACAYPAKNSPRALPSRHRAEVEAPPSS